MVEKNKKMELVASLPACDTVTRQVGLGHPGDQTLP